MDQLRAMQTFVNVVDFGSLTAAAREEGCSLPSVVRQLAGLEEMLGVRLLNRTTRRMALTGEGRTYLDHCRRILSDVQEATDAVSDQQGDPTGELRMTAPDLFGETLVHPLLTTYLARYPGVRIDLMLENRVLEVVDERIDLAVRIGRLQDSSLVAVPLGTMRLVLVASPALLKAHGTPETPSDLAELPAVSPPARDSNRRLVFNNDGREVRMAPNPRFVCSQRSLLIESCAAGIGIGQFPHYQVAGHIAGGRLVSILEDHEVDPAPVNLVYPASSGMTTRLRTLVDWLRDGLRESLAGFG